MKEGQPTYEQMCQVIGAVYSDAFLRIAFLEDENRQLRDAHHRQVESLRDDNARLREAEKVWNNGRGNCTSHVSSPVEPGYRLAGKNCSSSPPHADSDSGPPRSTGTSDAIPG